MSRSISSLKIEKELLGGLVRHPHIFAEIAPILKEKDFSNDVHATIYSIIKDTLSSGKPLDKVLLAQRIKDLGINFKEDLSVFDYVEALCFTQITAEALIQAAKELIKLRIRRELAAMGQEISQLQQKNADKTLDEIIAETDAIYGNAISSYEIEEKPCNLFENIEAMVEEAGNNPKDEIGYATPYPEFNRLYGGLLPKNLYAFASRSGAGKSTLLFDMGFRASLLTNFEIKVLFLDTEMETEDVRWRAVSSLSGVPMWYLKTGNWRKNADMFAKTRAALQEMKEKNFYIDHFKVGNKNIDEVCSLTRRWRYNIGRDTKAIVIYDYLKLTGERISESWKEYQEIGSKTDKLKKLGEELDVPILTAIQLNRSGEGTDLIDDSSAVALSDRLLWFATYLGIFRRKTVEEITIDGKRWGTHKLITLKTRFQGKAAPGHFDLIKRKFPDGKQRYVQNYLTFNVENFKVEEKGSLIDIIANATEKYDIKETPSEEESETL